LPLGSPNLKSPRPRLSSLRCYTCRRKSRYISIPPLVSSVGTVKLYDWPGSAALNCNLRPAAFAQRTGKAPFLLSMSGECQPPGAASRC